MRILAYRAIDQPGYHGLPVGFGHDQREDISTYIIVGVKH